MKKFLKKQRKFWLLRSVGIIFGMTVFICSQMCAQVKLKQEKPSIVSSKAVAAIVPNGMVKSAIKPGLKNNSGACKKLEEHQESKPKGGEPEIMIYPSPSMLWNMKNEELYAQCQIETTEETIKRLQEQIKKDEERWVKTE